MSTLQERLALAMAPPCTVTAADLARACKVKAPSVHQWINGPTKTLKGPNAVRAAHELGVNVEWLSTGRGPMRGTGEHGKRDEDPRPMSTREQYAAGDVAVLQLGLRSMLMTMLGRVPGTAGVFRQNLTAAAKARRFQMDEGLLASLLGIADEALDAEVAAAQALQRGRAADRTKPKK